jgi:hypothetical protein
MTTTSGAKKRRTEGGMRRVRVARGEVTSTHKCNTVMSDIV